MLLRQGIQIKNYVTKPAKIQLIEAPNIWERSVPIRKRKKIPTCWIELKITEGKNRQVRKMTAAISSPTLRLVRVSVADYKLDTLMPGEYTVIES